MTMDWNDASRITLTGDLSMVGVKEQHQLLKQYVASQAEVVTASRDQCLPLEIDLTGVQELNACGCQLLAAFLNNLRQLGATDYSFKLSDANRIKIHNLGFDDVIYNGGCP